MDLTDVEAELKARGLLLTTQRRAIVEFLSVAKTHPTAGQIHDATGAGSLSTVYNTLSLLQDLGLLRELPQPGGESRFDPNMRAHHHLRCVACGRLHDIDADAVAVLTSVQHSRVTVTLEGHCPEGCQVGCASA